MHNHAVNIALLEYIKIPFLSSFAGKNLLPGRNSLPIETNSGREYLFPVWVFAPKIHQS